jgi:glycosyltransferase involved in cell wall biosynthesis
VRVVFFMSHAGYTRNFEWTLRALAGRGDDVRLVFAKRKETAGGASDIVETLTDEYPNVQGVQLPERQPNGRSLVGRQLRVILDYMRYLEPPFEDTPKLRERAGANVPPRLRKALGFPIVRSRLGRALVAAPLRGAERSIGPGDDALALVAEHDPDLVLVTPLLEVGSPQHEYLRAAKRLGKRAALCVASWDNLTTSGLVHEVPDLVTVWNEAQREEAADLHRISPDRVAVTGAIAYDHWFDWKPSTTRDEFCRRVGVDPGRPYILYLCSSGFITPNEGDFVVRWIQQLRESGRPELENVGVIVRPHPTNTFATKRDKTDAAERLARIGNVAVWPREATNPVHKTARDIYFDSIHHADVVVGVNTSAQIESAIVGRRVVNVFAPEYRDTQQGTLHFKHLLSVNGGIVDQSDSVEEQFDQLVAALREDQDASQQARGFLEGFVRPYGIDEAATPRMLAALDELAERPAAKPAHAPWYSPFFKPSIAIAARAADRMAKKPKAKSKGAPAAAPMAKRSPLNPATWTVGLARLFLGALLAVPFLRTFLYRHVRPVLLSAVVAIEDAARPGRRSRHLSAVLLDEPAKPLRPAKPPKPAKASATKPPARAAAKPSKPGKAFVTAAKLAPQLRGRVDGRVTPQVVIGIPMYNRQDAVRRSLESLLVQTHGSIAFVVCDDGSTDATPDIVAEYAALDSRLHLERNDERLGMVGNWRRVFEVARRLHPSMEYFAWGSDHDVWHPQWASVLAAELDEHPEAVLAYPAHDVFYDDGRAGKPATSFFDTVGETSLDARARRTWRGMSAGSMVYGLVRADALAECGVYRSVLLPDRLLLSELALHGEFRQVPTVLWHRLGRPKWVRINTRQRRAFFPGKRPPLYTYLPWPLQHAAVLMWTTGIRRRPSAAVSRPRGLRLALAYLLFAVVLDARRMVARTRGRLSGRLKPKAVASAPATVKAEVVAKPPKERSAATAKAKPAKAAKRA